jgi:hypothetical protein
MSSDRDGQKWGKSEAYFGVVTCPEFEADRIAGNFDRFFEIETGRNDVSARMAQIQRLYGDVSSSRA